MTGVVIGRFMPPHRGHQYLIDYSARMVQTLYVLVCTLSHEPIPGELRYRWMKELFPTCTVIHITEEIPEAQRGQPGASAIWADAVRRYVPEPVNRVFASEEYGRELSRELGAEFILVDHSRAAIPVSATIIREDPLNNWHYIPPVVRPYYVKLVGIPGSPGYIAAVGRVLGTVVVEGAASDPARDPACDPARNANRFLLHRLPEPSQTGTKMDLIVTREQIALPPDRLAHLIRDHFGVTEGDPARH